jgi:CspA family cold shock protein
MSNLDSAGSATRATVKWFNPTKGFGFVTLDDGTDAFCHASALADVGITELPQGATVYCEVGHGQRGMQVKNVHNVDLTTADPNPPRGGGGGRHHGGEHSGPMGAGQVKFFNEQKGFGFVVPDTGGPDIYVHASALRRSGLPNIAPEQRVRYSTRQGMKGVEVDRIELD